MISWRANLETRQLMFQRAQASLSPICFSALQYACLCHKCDPREAWRQLLLCSTEELLVCLLNCFPRKLENCLLASPTSVYCCVHTFAAVHSESVFARTINCSVRISSIDLTILEIAGDWYSSLREPLHLVFQRTDTPEKLAIVNTFALRAWISGQFFAVFLFHVSARCLFNSKCKIQIIKLARIQTRRHTRERYVKLACLKFYDLAVSSVK